MSQHPSRSRPRGATLAEALVACAVLTLLGSCASTVLRTGLHSWKRGERRSTLQVEALLALHAVEVSVDATRTDGISLFPHHWSDAAGASHANDALAVFAPEAARATMNVP